MTASRYVPVYPAPDEYLASPSEMDIIDPEHRGYIAGTAKRTGITAPGFAEHAVYRLHVGWIGDEPRYEDGYFVYVAGQFMPSQAWHEDEYEAGRYNTTPPPAKKRKKVRP